MYPPRALFYFVPVYSVYLCNMYSACINDAETNKGGTKANILEGFFLHVTCTFICRYAYEPSRIVPQT